LKCFALTCRKDQFGKRNANIWKMSDKPQKAVNHL